MQISKEVKQYMDSKQYRDEHDAQSFRVLLDRGFTIRQIKALDKAAEQVFGKPTSLNGTKR